MISMCRTIIKVETEKEKHSLFVYCHIWIESVKVQIVVQETYLLIEDKIKE